MKPKKKTILVVDDRLSSLKVLAAFLGDEGYEVIQAAGPQKALEIFALRGDVDAVLSDLKMPGMDGLELFRRLNAHRKAPPFIIMTAYGTVKSAVGALKEGVAHYLIKPLDYDELVIVLEKAIRESEIRQELIDLKKQVAGPRGYHGIIGTTEKMQAIFEMVRTVGPTDASVLIYGETGTGKELLARALHLESRRAVADMVCINSAALSEDLLEAELFGYVRGAFTGAVADHQGRLEAADKSTLFLDEIGHMSLRLQAKLLRFLQEKAFEPVGSALSRRVDVRVIAATNLDLSEQIAAGRFLKDLLYRIEVIGIHLPPLRERREDIYPLVRHFIKIYNSQYERGLQGVTAQAMDALFNHGWPGNVRELKNAVARAVILSKTKDLDIADLPDNIRAKPTHVPENAFAPEKRTLKDIEKKMIHLALENCGGNKSLAAQSLGISRKTLYEKLVRHGLTGSSTG
jgi:DNA-binding NtrC family response regulator